MKHRNHTWELFLRHPRVKMSMQIDVKFAELISAAKRINHFNDPMALPVASPSQFKYIFETITRKVLRTENYQYIVCSSQHFCVVGSNEHLQLHGPISSYVPKSAWFEIFSVFNSYVTKKLLICPVCKEFCYADLCEKRGCSQQGLSDESIRIWFRNLNHCLVFFWLTMTCCVMKKSCSGKFCLVWNKLRFVNQRILLCTHTAEWGGELFLGNSCSQHRLIVCCQSTVSLSCIILRRHNRVAVL